MSGKISNIVAVGSSVVLMAALVSALPVTVAQADSLLPMTRRYSVITAGSIITIGNNLVTCSPSEPSCASAQEGADTPYKNTVNMADVDADNDPSTFNSSMSTLTMPAGATVLWAGLYWGGHWVW
ncbi:MAG: hypothetical protein FWD75_01165 [Propionibacteriaceae bacterium]|nr:hypothetical protein [Propionibacteriaceae bacterium]